MSTLLLPEKWRTEAASSFLATWVVPGTNLSRSSSGPPLPHPSHEFCLDSAVPPLSYWKSTSFFKLSNGAVPRWVLAPQGGSWPLSCTVSPSTWSRGTGVATSGVPAGCVPYLRLTGLTAARGTWCVVNTYVFQISSTSHS